MDTIDCLKIRRSVRVYKPDPIPDDVLYKIIEAASYAPSSKNTRPWEYFILKGKEKEEICDIVVAEYPKRGQPFRKREENAPTGSVTNMNDPKHFATPKIMTNVGSTTFIRQAPVLILVFNEAPYTAGEENVISEPSGESLLAHTVEIESCSAFIFSLLLAAEDLGLGGCWVADLNFARKKIKEFIGIDNDLVGAVVLGYPEIKPEPKQLNITKDQANCWH